MNHHKFIEKCLNRKISDATFYRIKSALFNAKLTLNKENLMIICELKKISKKHRVQLQIIINYYLEISNIDFKISGKNLYLYLVKITNFKPHRTTIIRWFNGDFIPDKIYSSDETKKIFLHALIYNLRKKDNGSQQKSNRSYPLSTKEK